MDWEDRELLNTALERLSDSDREVLILRELEGFSGAEAAEMIGIEISGMKSRLHRARLRLAARVRELENAGS